MTTRPDAPRRRAARPLFAARKREPKYFALGTAGGSAAAGAPGAPTTTTTATNPNTNTHARAQSYAEPVTTLRGARDRAALEDGVGEGSPGRAAGPRSGPTAIPRASATTAEQDRRDRDKDGRGLDLWRRSAESPAVGGGSTTGSESGSLTGTDEGDEFDRKMG
ncbi:hypothetical protein VE04_07280, partial [Pseudogymnoascus sp. 24MN13]